LETQNRRTGRLIRVRLLGRLSERGTPYGPMRFRPRLSVGLALLAIACPAIATERASAHIVQPGQKLASIAKRYKLSLDDLCRANSLRKGARIYPGQRLIIPKLGDELDANSASLAEGQANGVPSREHPYPSPFVKASMRADSTLSFAQSAAMPKRKGLVHFIGYHGDWQGQLVDRKSHLITKSVVAVSRILAWPHKDFRINDRLLALLAEVSDHFGRRPLHIVSGYRTTSWVEESKHPLGRACDFVVLGVPNTVLRDYLKTLENVGVGYYPNSTFVHLDVRERNTYWVDYASPGEPPRLTPTAVIPKDPNASADLQAEFVSPDNIPAASASAGQATNDASDSTDAPTRSAASVSALRR